MAIKYKAQANNKTSYQPLVYLSPTRTHLRIPLYYKKGNLNLKTNYIYIYDTVHSSTTYIYIYIQTDCITMTLHITERETRQLTARSMKLFLFLLSINWGFGTLS